MKKKKIIILFSIVILIIIIVVLLSKKSSNKTLDDVKNLNIVDKKYIASSEYRKIEYTDSKYMIFNGKSGYLLLDNKGNEIVKSKDKIEVIEDEITKKEYYHINGELFDMSTKKSLYKYDANIVFVNDNFVAYAKDIHKLYIYNLETKKEYNVVEYDSFGDISVLLFDNKYHVFTDNVEKSYKNKKETSGGAIFYNNDKDKIELNYFEDNKLKLTKDFYLDLSNECHRVKKYSDNKEISSECFTYDVEYGFDDENNFVKSSNGKIAVIRKLLMDDLPYNIILYPNEKYAIEENVNEGRFSGSKYIYNKDSKKEYIFDINGETKESKCAGKISSVNDIYVCSDVFDTYYMDSSFNKISDYYDSIECNKNGYCLVEQNGKVGLYYDDKEVIKPEYYYDAKIEDSYIILSTIYGYDIYILDKGREINKKELTSTKGNNGIDIDKVISDYKLEDIKNIIYDNKEDFSKYAYIVLNNDDLENYKRNILNYFKVYIDKREYVNESYFFYSLNDLKINVLDKVHIDIAKGEYADYNNTINILSTEKDNDHVINHELMHFFDFKMSNLDVKGSYLYNNKYITSDEYRRLSYDEKLRVKYVENNTITLLRYFIEGGAEKNNAYYFFDGELSAYYELVDEFNILEYLYGQKTLEEVYFGNKNLYEVFEKYYSIDEYNEFTELSNDFLSAYYEKNSDLKLRYGAKMTDKIIELYSKVYNKNIKEDKIICYLLSNYVNKVHTSKDTKYYDEYKYIISLRDKLEESFSKAYSIDKKSFKINRIHFNDNKLYCYVDYSNKKMKVEYDITNDIFKTLRENEA